MAVFPTATTTEIRVPLWIDRRAAPVALFLLTFAIYLTTLTQVHTFDALSYVTSVERKPWTEVFHPHHLAYGPLGVLALHAGRALGYTGGAALPMQVVNALAGALGVALFYTITRRVTQRADIGLVGALLLGGGYAYWYYAVEIEVYTVAALFLIICLDILTRPGWWRSRRSLLLLGLAQAGAVLFHQTNVLLCGPVLVYVIYDLHSGKNREPRTGEPETHPDGIRPRTKNRRTEELKNHPESTRPRTENHSSGSWFLVGPAGVGSWLQRWSIYASALGLAVALPYLFVGVVISGFRNWAAFETWLTEYARTG